MIPRVCKLHELGCAAHKRIEDHFSWETVAQQYIKVYKKYAYCK